MITYCLSYTRMLLAVRLCVPSIETLLLLVGYLRVAPTSFLRLRFVWYK